MGLDINTIVTLENYEKYKIIQENMYNGKKYFLAQLVNDNHEVISDEAIVFEEEIEGLDTYVKKVIDPDLRQDLLTILL